MLTKSEVRTTIPAADIERAVRWYDEKLGFKPMQRMEGAAMYQAGGGSGFLIYPTPNAGKAPQTVMGFSTADLDGEMRDLRGRGVVFEEYDMPGIKTVKGVAVIGPSRAAWFRDSEGNILGLFEMRG